MIETGPGQTLPEVSASEPRIISRAQALGELAMPAVYVPSEADRRLGRMIHAALHGEDSRMHGRGKNNRRPRRNHTTNRHRKRTRRLYSLELDGER